MINIRNSETELWESADLLRIFNNSALDDAGSDFINAAGMNANSAMTFYRQEKDPCTYGNNAC